MYVFLIILVLVVLLIYILYNMGFGWFRNGVCLMSFPKHIKNGIGHSFIKSSYSMQKIQRFNEEGLYLFVMNINSEQGDIVFELYDSEKNSILKLDNRNSQGIIRLIEKEKYTLKIRAVKFTGDFEITWRK